MPRLNRSGARAVRASYLCACALVTVFCLFLPYGGYERMMEGKYLCFLALALGYLAAMAVLAPVEGRRALPRPAGEARVMTCAAAAYLGLSALSALCSPYGAQTLLGGTRREGLVTLTLYAALFFCFSRYLCADTRLLCLGAAAAALNAALVIAQTAGGNPFGLYPAGLGYHDGDVAYAGFFAGTSGNADFTAFLLALALCVSAAAVVRLRLWALLPACAVTAWALARLGVATAAAGLACAAVWGLALLVPRKRRVMLLFSCLLTAAALIFVWRYDGGSQTLTEASRLLHGEWDGGFGSGRVAIWRECLTLARQRPLLGGGPDTMWLRGVEPFVWHRDGVATPVDITAAHNEYLGILVNQGIFALAAYLALLGAALVRCFRRAEEPKYALCGAGLLCYAAMALFSVSTCITAFCVWMLLAVVHKDENMA